MRRMKRILVITQMYPSGSTGTSVKTLHTLELLAEKGVHIDVVCPHYSKMVKVSIKNPRIHVYPFEKQTISKLSFPYLWRAWRLLFSWKPFRVVKLYDHHIRSKINTLMETRSYNYIFFDGFSTLQYASSYDTKNIYVDDEDIVDLLWKRSSSPGNIFLRLFFFVEWIKCQLYERLFFPRMARVWAISPNTKARLGRISRARVSIMPTIVGERRRVFNTTSSHIVFSGLLSWQENVVGLRWFLANCWMQIHQQFPHTKLYITGQMADEALATYTALFPNVVLTGFVKDLSSIYKQCAVAIAPIFINAGIKVKILTYLGFGLPVVANKEATWGMKSTRGIEVANKKDFANAIAQLLKQPKKRIRLSQQGRQNILAHHSKKTLFHFFATEGILS
jgi:glycosyltransferase involved in cell wall biosynthesis